MTNNSIILIIIVAAIVTWIVTRTLIPLLSRIGSVDIPNFRSSHKIPTPRGGGIGIAAGIMAGLIVAFFLDITIPGKPYLGAVALMFLVGVIDDRTGKLSSGIRLLLQFVAAGLIVGFYGELERLPFPYPLNVQLGILGIPCSLIWLVGVTNIFNFLDGIDGFATLQGLIAGLGLAIVGDGGVVTTVGLVLVGATIGFIGHNWHPAKVFMGDSGSLTLGFAIAALPFLTIQSNIHTTIFTTTMLLWFFLADGTFTIFRRLKARQKIWEPHRTHLYQRLTIAGMRHDIVVIRVGVGMGIVGIMAVFTNLDNSVISQWVVLVTAISGFFLYLVLTYKYEKSSKAIDGLPNSQNKL